MNFRHLLFSLLAASCFLFWIPAALCEAGHRHHEAHQHGLAELGIVQEGQELSIVFRAPASDLVGFEHAAKTDEQKAAVSELESVLERSDKLFLFLDEAGCSPEKHTLDHALLEEEKHEHGHGHSHEHDHDDSGTHSEVTASYSFTCKESKNLSSVKVSLFQEFPSLKKIEVSIVTASFQGKQALSPSVSTIKLTK